MERKCATKSIHRKNRYALITIGDDLFPIILAFVAGSVFSLICGCSPFTLYGFILKRAFMSAGGLLNTLGYATPIIITAIATAMSMQANMFNMGVEGQAFVGAFVAALAGYMVKGLPTILHILVCLILAMLFAAAYALIPGLLKAKLRINEVVTTIMLNSIATIVTSFLTQGYFGTGDAYAHTEFIAQTARLPQLDRRYRASVALFV